MFSALNCSGPIFLPHFFLNQLIFLCGPHNFFIPKFYHPNFFVDPHFCCWRKQFKWNKFGAKKFIGVHNKFGLNLGVKPWGSKIGHKKFRAENIGVQTFEPVNWPFVNCRRTARFDHLNQTNKGFHPLKQIITGFTHSTKIIRGLTSN